MLVMAALQRCASDNLPNVARITVNQPLVLHSRSHRSGTISVESAVALSTANHVRGAITILSYGRCTSIGFSQLPHQLNVLLAVIPWRHNDISSISSCGLPLSTTVALLCRAKASRHQPGSSEKTKKRAPGTCPSIKLSAAP